MYQVQCLRGQKKQFEQSEIQIWVCLFWGTPTMVVFLLVSDKLLGGPTLKQDRPIWRACQQTGLKQAISGPVIRRWQ